MILSSTSTSGLTSWSCSCCHKVRWVGLTGLHVLPDVGHAAGEDEAVEQAGHTAPPLQQELRGTPVKNQHNPPHPFLTCRCLRTQTRVSSSVWQGNRCSFSVTPSNSCDHSALQLDIIVDNCYQEWCWVDDGFGARHGEDGLLARPAPPQQLRHRVHHNLLLGCLVWSQQAGPAAPTLSRIYSIP